MTLRRRTVLGLLGSVAVAGRLQRARAQGPPSVVVVGGGPAGVSAALELAERGVRVTLLEAHSARGGKVKGWEHTLPDGTTADAEHGVHGWWRQYVNFRDLLTRQGLVGHLTAASGAVAWRDGAALGDRATPPQRRAGMERLQQVAAALGMEPLPRALRQGREYFSTLTTAAAEATLATFPVSSWTDPPAALFTLLPDALAHAMYFVPPKALEAAEYALGERFYGAGGARNAEVEWLRGNPQERIWEPLHGRLLALGVEVRLSTRATESWWRAAGSWGFARAPGCRGLCWTSCPKGGRRWTGKGWRPSWWGAWPTDGSPPSRVAAPTPTAP